MKQIANDIILALGLIGAGIMIWLIASPAMN